MTIKSFYKGYLAAFMLIMILCMMKFTFIEVMAIIGTALTGTVIIFALGWILYRTFIYLYTERTQP